MTDDPTPFAERDALYYPNIHIRDEEWLKRTLLFFPHVARMVPQAFTPQDEGLVLTLTDTISRGAPLLRSVELEYGAVPVAQAMLHDRLSVDLKAKGDRFIRRFDKEAALAAREPGDEFGFQMHREKAIGAVIRILLDNRLAWEPDLPDHEDYLELHPVLGEAILGTTAVAAALEEGLDIVADGGQKKSRELNLCVATQDLEGIYDRLVRGDPLPQQTRRAEAGDAVDIIIHHHCDASKITPEKLQELGKEREPLAKLRDELQRLVADIPPMLNEDRLQALVKDRVREAFRKWEADQATLGAVVREIFGVEGARNAGDFIKRLAEKAAAPATGAAVGSRIDPYVGTFAGFGVGIIIHAVSSVASVRTRAKESKYRYMTMASDAGVAFTIGDVAAQA